MISALALRLLPLRAATPTLATAMALLALGGCAALPHAPAPLPMKSAPALGLAAPIEAPIAPDWWQTLGDPQLNRIMADSLAGNPGLDAALARMKLSQGAIANFRAGLLPQASASAGTSYERLSENYLYPSPLGGSWRAMSTAQADIAYSFDFAGRQKAMVALAGDMAQGSVLDVAAARVALAGTVAQTYVNLARAEAQARLARDFVVSRQNSLRLIEARQKASLASGLDINAAKTLLAEAQQAETRAQGAKATLQHALAALAGRGTDYAATIAPTTLRLDGATLPVPQALPLDLLGRRADVLSALAHIDAATQARKVARADFYPNVSLRAFVGASALGIGKLFTGGSLDGGAGPAISLPIFSGGALRARYGMASNGLDIAIAQYNQSVVRAVQEAADALSAIDTNSKDARQQHAVLAGLEATVKLDHVREASGLGTKLDVLNSDERLLSARQSEVDLAADGLARRIQLLVALGGGFAPASSPNSSQNTPKGDPK